MFTLHLGLLSFLGSFCQKKHVFIKRNFQMKYFELFIYCIYSCPNMWLFSYNQFWINMNFWKCTNFAKSYVLSWKFVTISNHTKNILTFSKTLYILWWSHNFFKQHIHCITFICRKGFMNFFKTLNIDEHKIEKTWKFECILDVFNSTLSLQKKWGWNKFYDKN